jgi:hypothetical protein
MLEKIKTLLGLKDTAHDDLLNEIITITEGRLKNLLGGVEVLPETLSYVELEVCIARFNRIGSEGLSSHTVEGETMQWSDDDFAPYTADIEAYNVRQSDATKGKVRFL